MPFGSTNGVPRHVGVLLNTLAMPNGFCTSIGNFLATFFTNFFNSLYKINKSFKKGEKIMIESNINIKNNTSINKLKYNIKL